MDVLSELQARARECREMATVAADQPTKAVWQRMAERWERMLERAAKDFEHESAWHSARADLPPATREVGSPADPSSYVLRACVSALEQNFRPLALEPLPEQHHALLDALEARLAGKQQDA